MDILDELLAKRGVTVDELQPHEQEQYFTWLDVLSNDKPVTADQIKTYIQEMKHAIELELVDTDEFVYVLWFRIVNRKHVALKARLKNYLLLEAFLTSKEKARTQLQNQIRELINKDTPLT